MFSIDAPNTLYARMRPHEQEDTRCVRISMYKGAFEQQPVFI